MVHGHDDGRAAEGAVARGEHCRVLGAHAFPFGGDAVLAHQAVAFKVRGFGLLADGGNHHAAVDVMLGTLDHHRAAAAVFGVRLAHFGGDAFQRQAVALRLNRNLLGVVDEFDVFLDGALELVLAGRDLVGPAPVDHFHGLAAGHAQGRAAGVHGDIAAADDHNGLGQFRALARIDAAQERDPVDHILVVLSGDAHGLAPPGADGEQHRVMALFQLFHGDAVAERRVEMQRDAGALVEEAVHVLFDDVGRAAEPGDAPDHHAAGPVRHLIDVDLVAGDREVVRRGEAGRSGADNADALSCVTSCMRPRA